MEALHPSATCRSAWVIHGGHFVSKSHHKSVCREDRVARTHSVCRPSTQRLSDVSETVGRNWVQRASSQNLNSTLFICSTRQLLFLCSPLIIQSRKTGGGHVCCIYPWLCYLRTLEYNSHTCSSLCSHIKTFLLPESRP